MNSLLALVLVGHFVGDWIVQTDSQAMNKMKGGIKGYSALFAHVWTYTITMFIFVSACFVERGGFWAYHAGLYWLLGISAVTHAVIDLRWPVRWLMRVTGSPNFSKVEWGVIATDQALHLSILLLVVAIIQR